MKALFFVLLILSAVTGVSSGVDPQVTLLITGAVDGNIVLELYADQAPVTVANFVDYVQGGFYDGLIFHRVIEDFMIQAGGFDPNLVPATSAPAIINESTNGLANLRGTIAMARTTAPHTAKSQFYINHVDNPSLDFGAIAYGGGIAYYRVGYCVFGEVISGMEVVDAIALVPTAAEGSLTNVPVIDVVIESATVTLNAPFCPEKLVGDTDGDCDVDFADFVSLAENWLECNSTTITCD